PITAFRHEISSTWISSFLAYTPNAVQTAKTIPAVFLATSSWVSAAVGFTLAVLLALRGRSLITVALVAAAGVWVTEFVTAQL
ncbi:MAG: AzlD domain-containing protein, partial [Actinomycetes bacterium]|nr:AzlD domain-containing protein [Actinomycetes bacterium]